jgi:hypothetical protein
MVNLEKTFKIGDDEYSFVSELFSERDNRYMISYRINWTWYYRTFRANYLWMATKKEIVPRWYVIHHKDHNSQNDVVDNLNIITRAEHNRTHYDNPNRHMFKEWNTFWKKPKSEWHKEKISEAHIERVEEHRLVVTKIAIEKMNPEMSEEEFWTIINRKRTTRRVFKCWFRLFRTFVTTKLKWKWYSDTELKKLIEDFVKQQEK